MYWRPLECNDRVSQTRPCISATQLGRTQLPQIMKINCILLSVQPVLLIPVVPNNVEYITIREENIYKNIFVKDNVSRGWIKGEQPEEWDWYLLTSSPTQGDSQVARVVKNPPAYAGKVRAAGLIPRSGRSPGGGHGHPLKYSCLENHMDREAWWATVHRVTKSRTKDWSDLARISPTQMILLHLHSDSRRQTLSFSLYKRGDWGSDRLEPLVRVTAC